jgi:hypothetical protein
MKTRWNCPSCPMSSPRHWNVVRHISRIHDGIGEPTSDFMMRSNRNPNSIAESRSPFHRGGRGSYSYSQPYTSTKEQRSKTLIQSMDEFIEPIKKLVEYKNLLNQLSVLDQQQQAPRQLFYPSIISSPELEDFGPSTIEHPISPISVSDFYGHIKFTAQKFASDCNKPSGII